jgi:hypothetical protein
MPEKARSSPSGWQKAAAAIAILILLFGNYSPTDYSNRHGA